MAPTSANPPRQSPYQHGLDRSPANHLPLTPLGFLDRSAQVHPQGVSVIHAGTTQTWQQTRERAYRLASALWCSAVCNAARRSLSSRPTPRRCWRRTWAFHCPARSSTPSTADWMRRASASTCSTVRRGFFWWKANLPNWLPKLSRHWTVHHWWLPSMTRGAKRTGVWGFGLRSAAGRRRPVV